MFRHCTDESPSNSTQASSQNILYVLSLQVTSLPQWSRMIKRPNGEELFCVETVSYVTGRVDGESCFKEDFRKKFIKDMELLDSGRIFNNSFKMANGSGEFGMRGAEVNLSESGESEFYRHSFPVTIVLICAYIVIFAIGFVGNSLVVIVVLRSPRMRTVTNLFIMNLAFADLLVVIFCLPPNLLSNILVPWVLGWWMCKTVPYVQGVSVCASVYSLVAVSLDRFIAIWFPLWGGLTRGKARIIIVIIWFAACTVAAPWALYFDLITHGPSDSSQEFCVEVWPSGVNGDMYFLVGNLFLCYLFPLSGISMCYLLIWVRVIRRHVPTDSADALQKVHQKAKIGVLKMLVVVVLAFLLSWLPLYTLFIRVKFGSALDPWEDSIVDIVTPIAQWLGSSNSCINPVLYAYLNVKFRRAFQSLQPQCCRPQPTYNHTSTKSSLLIIPRPATSVYHVTTGV